MSFVRKHAFKAKGQVAIGKLAHGGKFIGYGPLVEEIIKFFKTGKVPVPEEETIEIYAFMSAADESKTKGAAAASIESVIEKAKSKYK